MTHWGFTALHQAIRRDNALRNIDAMLDHGADPAQKTRVQGESSFAIAARRGRGDVLVSFERRGIAIVLDGVERLIAACARSDGETVRSIAASEPQLVNDLILEGGTLLVQFAGNGNTDGIRLLLDLGVDIAATCKEPDPYFDVAKESTALHVAAWRARHDTVRFLIERGAPVNVFDGKTRTPLVLAVKACVDSQWTDRRSPESVAALIQAGAWTRRFVAPSGYAEVDALLGLS
jgi:ankyrin repeat protein